MLFRSIKCAEHLFPHDVFEKVGYVHRAVHGQKGYHGVATVSRIPLREIGRHDWQDNGEARHIGVELLGPGNGLIVENVYIPAGGDVADREVNAKFGQKLDFLERMTRWAEKIERPTLIVGDFNIAPLECDVYDHKALLKVVSHTPSRSRRCNALPMPTAGSILAASISPRPNATIRGGPTAPTGAPRIRGAGLTICGPRPKPPRRPVRTVSSKRRASGSSLPITSRSSPSWICDRIPQRSKGARRAAPRLGVADPADQPKIGRAHV